MVMIQVEFRRIHRGLYIVSSLFLSVPLVDEKSSEFNGIMLGLLVDPYLWVVYHVLCQMYSFDDLANSTSADDLFYDLEWISDR